MNTEKINTLDGDEYWAEAEKYILKRFNSKKGQKKLKEFQDAQKKFYETTLKNFKKYGDKREALRGYITKGLEGDDDIFDIDGIGYDKIYDKKASMLYTELRFFSVFDVFDD